MTPPFPYQTALITGGGSGIGRGIALALARRGVDLALVGRRTGPLEDTARAVSDYGVRAVALPTDLRDTAAGAGLLDRVASALRPPDLLVHNAGVLAGGELLTLSPEEVAGAVALNLAAPLDLTRRALPELIARKGAVVLIASTMALVPFPASSLYSATKAGVHAFGAALRYELEPQGVRVLVAYPPSTDTAMVRGMARAAGLPIYPLARPAWVGERIVRGLERGQPTAHFNGGERLLTVAYTLAPWLVRAVLRHQRRRITRMMMAGKDEPPC